MRSTLAFALFALTALVGCGTSSLTVPEWESTGGPNAQNVSALYADERNPGTLFAGLTTGEIYRSIDSGRAWGKMSGLVPPSPIRRFVQDPESLSVFFAETDAGLFVSSDRGKLWNPAGPSVGPTRVLSRVLAIDPWKGSVRYIGTAGAGVYKSTDGGVTWVQSNGGADSLLVKGDVNDITIAASRPDVLFAAVFGLGIVRSMNGGGTWERVTPQFSPLTAVATHVLVHSRDDALVLYATDAGTIARSVDRGDHWTVTRQEDEAWRVLTLTPDPLDPDVVYAGAENGLLVSTNFGASWSQPLSTLPIVTTSVALMPAQPRSWLFAFGPGLGLQASTDGGATWNHSDSQLGGADVAFVATNPSGEKVFTAVGPALLRLDQASGGWVPASTGLSGGSVTSLAFDVDSSNVIFATTTGGTFRSLDGGIHWKPIARNVRMSARLIETHPTIHTRMLASGPLGIFVSTDKGNSWSQTKPQGNKFTFDALTFTPTNAGVIHAATGSLGVLLSNDGGIRWEQSRYGLTSDTISAITMDNPTPTTYFAWTARGECFTSTNKGLEWNRFNPPWKRGDTIAIAFDRLEPNSVVAVVNGREVLYSRTGGREWLQIVPDGARYGVRAMHWNARRAFLYIGTADRGILRLNLGQALKEYPEE